MQTYPRCTLTIGLLVSIATGCEAPLPPPPRGSCAGELPMLGDGSERLVTFPARDLVCTGSRTPCETTRPLRSDEERTVTVRNELGGATVVYVLDVLSIPVASVGEVVGFDLDGLDSGEGSTAADADCREFHQDFESDIEPGVVGVDNAFSGLVFTVEGLLDPADCRGGTSQGCIGSTISAETIEGLLLLLELTEVDSLEHDPSVGASLYLGRTTDGAAPQLADERRLAPGQTFDTVRVLAPEASADIFHGRLRVRWPRVELPFSMWAAPRALERTELRAGLCPNGLFHGHLGGAATAESLAQQAIEGEVPYDEETVWSVLESIADLRPSAADPALCDLVSVGYALEGVPARRAP